MVTQFGKPWSQDSNVILTTINSFFFRMLILIHVSAQEYKPRKHLSIEKSKSLLKEVGHVYGLFPRVKLPLKSWTMSKG